MSKLVALELLAGSTHAVRTVGIVLAEAGALYVGYGAMTTVIGPKIQATLEGEQ
ncbi:DUF7512 family protein [Haladaptatus sp. ZSTT2]|uniref:DUF7512 family protein n=1 Tax=Haladaptatus sp. ZSTT2 TaxID=3120515 RepID=UPI003FA586CB